MKHLTQSIPHTPAYHFDGSAAFFDIETTGLSARASILFLIGIIYQKDDIWYLTQWLNDDGDSEVQIITNFFAFIKTFDTLIHYNGTTFDIPYIKKRCDILNIPCDFTRHQSIDLYQRIRPIGKRLQFPSLKQQAVEESLYIRRTESITGKDLVKLYFLYLKLRRPDQEASLLHHNYDDLIGMLSICSLLAYEDMLAGKFCIQANLESESFHLKFSLEEPLPYTKREEQEYFSLTLGQKTGEIMIPVYQGTLKYFFSNYKDYYFLPMEDTAIHKSVAAYVDTDYRQKAKADTCYIKKEGRYLPQLTSIYEPAFRKERKDKISYIEITNELLHNGDFLHSYALSFLNTLFQ